MGLYPVEEAFCDRLWVRTSARYWQDVSYSLLHQVLRCSPSSFHPGTFVADHPCRRCIEAWSDCMRRCFPRRQQSRWRLPINILRLATKDFLSHVSPHTLTLGHSSFFFLPRETAISPFLSALASPWKSTSGLLVRPFRFLSCRVSTAAFASLVLLSAFALQQCQCEICLHL